MADIFVSYTSSDREWAHWIALDAHVHEWEIEGSESDLAPLLERQGAQMVALERSR